ncbi:MaoC family dehydratase [Gordonia sp. CPCC 206044]|uniref:MaoC family dehydratase n=1 Tax=Gordonia sp. CPCC 206044 TaxID=3140793 RepID=UPI003AF35D30
MSGTQTGISVTEPAQLIWDVIEEITPMRVRQYADASGDHNTIHTDVEAAHAAGLIAPVAQGLLVVGIVLGHADVWARRHGVRLTGYDTRFVRPVYLGSESTALHVTGRLVSPGHLSATAAVLDDDGASRAVLRPIRILYTAD